MGSHFHHGRVSRGPPIIPDGRVSRVRFETLASLPWVFPSSPRVKRWFTCAPVSAVYPQPRSTSCVGLPPARCPAAALTTKPPSVQSPFAPCRRYLHRRDVPRLLGGHYSSVLARTDSCANPVWLSPPSATASFEESLQLATSRCCHRDLPDVISANLSSDAWSPTTAVPRSASTCFFLRVFGLPQQGRGSASRDFPRTRLFAERFSRLQTFRYVQASEFAHLPDRSYRCAYYRRAAEAFTSEQNMFRYLHMHRIC